MNGAYPKNVSEAFIIEITFILTGTVKLKVLYPVFLKYYNIDKRHKDLPVPIELLSQRFFD